MASSSGLARDEGAGMSNPEPGSMPASTFLDRYERAVGQKLNPQQKDAILHGNGPLFIMAGPGSGKSEVMVARALKLVLVDSVPAGSVILTTFTEKAARNLEDRIGDRLLAMGYTTTLEDLRLGTLHSLCDEVMREYRYPDYYDVRLLNETEQSFFVYANCDWIDEASADYWNRFRFLHPRASQQYGPNRWQKAETLRTLFNRITEEEVDLPKLARSRDKHLRELAHATGSYWRLLKEKGRSDFSYLQFQFKGFLGTKIGQKFLSGDPARGLPPIRHILVDEYQDTNPIQESVYFSMARAAGGNITVVGDDDQALYRFRGGTVECLVRFPTRCKERLKKNPKEVQLVRNYRSLPEITKWAEQVLGAQPEMRKPSARAPKKPMQNARESVGGFVAVCRVEGRDHDEAGKKVADVVRELIRGRRVEDPSQIAILLRSSRESPQNAGPVTTHLRAAGVKVYNPRSKAFLEAEEIEGMLGSLLEVLDRGQHIGGSLRGFVQNSISSWRAAYKLLANKHEDLRRYVQSVHKELAHRRPGETLPVTLRDVFYRILSQEPFTSWQEDPNRTSRLGQLSAILESFASVESDYLAASSVEPGRFSHGWLRGRFYPRLIGYLHQASLDDPEDAEREIVAGAVQVMTVHQAKGLEFPVVFVDSVGMKPRDTDPAYVLEDLLVGYSSNARALASARERAVQDTVRFFYVAYTRPKNLLCAFGREKEFRDSAIGLGRRA